MGQQGNHCALASVPRRVGLLLANCLGLPGRKLASQRRGLQYKHKTNPHNTNGYTTHDKASTQCLKRLLVSCLSLLTRRSPSVTRSLCRTEAAGGNRQG
eukprot:6198858-Pleurochrysis_carterae.AAC.2